MTYARKVPTAEHRQVADRVRNGETLVAVGDEYGVSRERIRQIARLVYPNWSSRTSQDDLISRHIESMIEQRFWYKPVGLIFEEMPFTRSRFEGYLKRVADPEQRERWLEANQRSSSKAADRYGRNCVTCRVYKEWSDYYHDKSTNNGTINGRSHRCAECTKTMVRHYYNQRNVPTPTVTEKRCPKCDETKPASDFHRATKQATGLQTYCKTCHREM